MMPQQEPTTYWEQFCLERYGELPPPVGDEPLEDGLQQAATFGDWMAHNAELQLINNQYNA